MVPYEQAIAVGEKAISVNMRAIDETQETSGASKNGDWRQIAKISGEWIKDQMFMNVLMG